ncbi:MAG: endonuclease III [candidate division KSB1 bacterium]|nr:endonuclease III [candidate division KSB1 bacterium]MDZ7304128.1 endonuclease III [candidate division KSB1 bacterium]MDZ7314083.1 endonuclease III [candidate division KSB1 bacterium]
MPKISKKTLGRRAVKYSRAATRHKQPGKPTPSWSPAKVSELLDRLEKAYPMAHLELNFTTPLDLLIATIMAAQCTDKLVNEVTATLFKKYPKAEDYAQTPLAELEQDIRPVTFYQNKARHIQKCCQQLVEKHGGEVPADLEALVELPGVGRKTANIVLAHAFGQQTIAVDTHVKRLATERLYFSRQTDPDKIEMELRDIIPPGRYTRGTILLQWHGRYTCQARQPRCNQCVIVDLCPYEKKMT